MTGEAIEFSPSLLCMLSNRIKLYERVTKEEVHGLIYWGSEKKFKRILIGMIV